MPETPPSGGHNKKLLLVAFLLGLVFVALFNVKGCIEARRRAENQMDFVLIEMDLPAGKELDATNITRITLPRDVGERLKGLYLWRDVVPGQTKVYNAVEKNNLLRNADIRGSATYADDVLRGLGPDERTVNIKVTKLDAPAAYLRRGSRVDLYGKIATVKGKAPEVELIMSNVEVTAVGTEAEPGAESKNFQTISIKLHEDVVRDFEQIKEDRLLGNFSIAIRKPSLAEGGTLTQAALMALKLPPRLSTSGAGIDPDSGLR